MKKKVCQIYLSNCNISVFELKNIYNKNIKTDKTIMKEIYKIKKKKELLREI